MRRWRSDLTRQVITTAVLSAFAIAALIAGAGSAGAADMPEGGQSHGQAVYGQCAPKETVILFDENGWPTVVGRTPYYTCVTGSTLLPGQIPPPPEYCCS